MKNIFTASLLFFLALVMYSSGQTTFSGSKADWGWSSTTTNEQVIDFLKSNWKEGNQLSLQNKAKNAGLDCEFLWKVTPDQVEKALASGSSFMTGEKADSLTLMFYSNGKGEITLYSQGKICGWVQAWTATKRQGEYCQLSAGDYKVTGLQVKGWSNTFKTPMPYKVSLSGEAASRGIFIHQGDLSGEKPGINEYHGCIRISRLTGQRFMKILSVGTTVKVVWK
jgi:lipoprotein-anchoring transpeptidase ErfK/SrfK